MLRNALNKPRFGKDKGLNSSHSLSEIFTYLGLGLAGTAIALGTVYAIRTADFNSETVQPSSVAVTVPIVHVLD